MMSTTIQTELFYLIPSTENPIFIASESGAEARLDVSARFAPHAVTIGRLKPGQPFRVV